MLTRVIVITDSSAGTMSDEDWHRLLHDSATDIIPQYSTVIPTIGNEQLQLPRIQPREKKYWKPQYERWKKGGRR